MAKSDLLNEVQGGASGRKPVFADSLKGKSDPMSKMCKTEPADHPLLFEIGTPGLCAASLSESDVPAANRKSVPAELLAKGPPPLPEIGELDLVRHYKKLAHRCFSIDGNFYPLGSCT